MTNQVTLGDICRLFCCPPWPSRIVAKLAFLPPEPTYSIITDISDARCKLVLKPEAGWQFGDGLKDQIEVFLATTRQNSRIACMYIKAPSDHAQYTLLFSHGNAVDIGQMSSFLQSLSMRFNVNVLCYDYSGYGASSGQALESNLYADAEAALAELVARYDCPLDRIVLYGQSIGTAPTVELASRNKVAGVVLHSPLMSGLSVVCPGSSRRHCYDPFANIHKVARIRSPTLIIHGIDDEIIEVSHGHQLHDRLTRPLDPAWVDGAGHNDVEAFPEYSDRLGRFFTEDLPREAETDRLNGDMDAPTAASNGDSKQGKGTKQS